tara:strand:+ start:3931 stop:4194 length:264 start_codon:yes stop_codon:yes gene_type:complete
MTYLETLYLNDPELLKIEIKNHLVGDNDFIKNIINDRFTYQVKRSSGDYPEVKMNDIGTDCDGIRIDNLRLKNEVLLSRHRFFYSNN